MFTKKNNNLFHSDFHDLRSFLDFHGMSSARGFQIARVHQSTWERWMNGQRPPPATVELLRLHATGEPPSMGREWHHWRFVENGLTCALFRRIFRPSDILMIPALETQAKELQNIKNNYALQSKLF